MRTLPRASSTSSSSAATGTSAPSHHGGNGTMMTGGGGSTTLGSTASAAGLGMGITATTTTSTTSTSTGTGSAGSALHHPRPNRTGGGSGSSSTSMLNLSAGGTTSPSLPPSTPIPPNTNNTSDPLTRAEEEQIRKERAVAELVSLLVEYKPIIPDAVTDHLLMKAGFECDDVRIKRLIALSTQKFITDIATDALQFCKLRQQSLQGRRAAKERRLCLTMADLVPALAEYGVSVKKPEYYL